MTILAELLIQCRNLIGDTSALAPTFEDATLTDYINRAIADLNAYFPRRSVYTLEAQAGVHTYHLLNVHQQVIAVEFPAEDEPAAPGCPRRCLQRVACTSPEFWASPTCYDFLPSNDADSLNPPRLILSASPAGGETIRLELTTEHNPLSDPTDVTTIPERFLHLIALFVRWKTMEALASKEAMDPNPLKGLTSVHGLNAERAETAYRSALAAANAAFTESAFTAWANPRPGRIY